MRQKSLEIDDSFIFEKDMFFSVFREYFMKIKEEFYECHRIVKCSKLSHKMGFEPAYKGLKLQLTRLALNVCIMVLSLPIRD